MMGSGPGGGALLDFSDHLPPNYIVSSQLPPGRGLARTLSLPTTDKIAQEVFRAWLIARGLLSAKLFFPWSL